ncbi:MAG: hypothetical protein RIQ52_2129, partial [Pseudomonadota bacterium]
MSGDLTPTGSDLGRLSDDEFQAYLLAGVSRTFALTIPQLPAALARPVSNAYLLCRIVDTIEDEPAIDGEQKRSFCRLFAAVVRGEADAGHLARELAPLLSSQTLATEHELIAVMPRVIRITHGFDPEQKQALSLCVEIMSQGMADFQSRDLTTGLGTLQEMGDYCYYVAGVVGEMLTRLFCHYSPEIDRHRDEMMRLSVSFGQGLQMTNILKDLWDDHDRGVCWLPKDIFVGTGFDLANLHPGHRNERFKAGYRILIGIALGHLENALRYTMLIPTHESGIRQFCLWALGMAVMTLRKINSHLDFSTSAGVKISRRTVHGTVLISRLTHRCDFLLGLAFSAASLGLPRAAQDL